MVVMKTDGNGGYLINGKMLAVITLLLSIISATIGASMALATTQSDVEHNSDNIQKLEVATDNMQVQMTDISISLARIEQKVDDVRENIH